jgi:hypothetical protein
LDSPNPTHDPFEPPPSAVIVSSRDVRLALAPHLIEPATDGTDRELGRIVDADTDEAGVCRHVINAHMVRRLPVPCLRNSAPSHVADRLWDDSPSRRSVVADQFLFLRIDRNGGLIGGSALDLLGVDVVELSVAIRMFLTLVGLAVALPTVAQRRQKPASR